MKVHFQPEAWMNDYAVPVDDEGADTWTVTPSTAVMIGPEHAAGRDLDFVKGDPNAPEWVREWRGPFTINLLCAEGDHVNDDNPGRPICRTCDDDPGVAALYPTQDG